VLKRTVVIGTALAVLVAMGPLSAFAQGTKKTEKTATTAAKTTEHPKMHTMVASSAANTFAVCGCGKVFVPDANTKYIEVNGKKYACCSDGCHAMALKDPAGAAKMADENMAKVMTELNPPATKPTN
jgi:hypothetical protein